MDLSSTAIKPSTEFSYNALKHPNSFRLLRILRDEHTLLSSPLRCLLEHHILPPGSGDHSSSSLGTASTICPPYAAISYCWGDPKSTESITVNGASASITVSLAAALSQLRHDARPDELYLWADALCINQDDAREKARQIGLMPRIYTGASKVVTWLSHDDRDAEHLAQLAGGSGSGGSSAGTARLRHPRHRRDQDAFVRAVSALSGKSYWSRIWIVQELSLARRVEVVCKGQRVPWARFVQLACSHLGLPLECSGAGNVGSAGPAAAAAAAVLPDSRIVELDAIRRDVQNSVPMPTIRALYRTRACQSTVKADRVFALLGLTSDGRHKIGRLRYHDEHQMTLLNLTLAEMEGEDQDSGGGGRLDLITFPDRRDAATYTFRTWSPNWINRSLWRRLRVWQLHQILQSQGDYFRAGIRGGGHGRGGVFYKFDPKKGLLKVQGYSLGVICASDAPAKLQYQSPSSLAVAVDSLIMEFPESSRGPGGGNEAFDWAVDLDEFLKSGRGSSSHGGKSGSFKSHTPRSRSSDLTNSIASLELESSVSSLRPSASPFSSPSPSPSPSPYSLSRHDSNLSTTSTSSLSLSRTNSNTTTTASPLSLSRTVSNGSTSTTVNTAYDPLASPSAHFLNRRLTTVRAAGSGVYRGRLQALLTYLEPLALRKQVTADEWLIAQDSEAENEPIAPVDAAAAVAALPVSKSNSTGMTWVKRDPAHFRAADKRFTDELRALLYLGSTHVSSNPNSNSNTPASSSPSSSRSKSGTSSHRRSNSNNSSSMPNSATSALLGTTTGSGASDVSLADAHFSGTSKGLIGLVRGGTRPGDAVYVIEGCGVPVVLRRWGAAAATTAGCTDGRNGAGKGTGKAKAGKTGKGTAAAAASGTAVSARELEMQQAAEDGPWEVVGEMLVLGGMRGELLERVKGKGSGGGEGDAGRSLLGPRFRLGEREGIVLV